jgi:hypothetical protein
MNIHVRSVAVAGALAMILAACGGGEVAVAPEGSATSSAAPGAAPASSPSSGAASETPVEPAEGGQSPADPDAVIAPDFTLALGEGGEFALSEEALPVYMVFWAEW